MAGVTKENQWRNCKELIVLMDAAIPYFAGLDKEKRNEKLVPFCDALANHPDAISHRKLPHVIKQHMDFNVGNFLESKPMHH
ncbi:hypothetical protein MKY91_17420 [Alkalicoccobacillus gibsonii]|uniref:Uncharacterized protein n=1 Tax=Alkalicoccobacillus gibsonii TaxID=79881 RepID=A0ABU9VM07_9BACI